MYRLFDLIKAVRATLQPYHVSVLWDGRVYHHRAWTTGDARAWFSMYPNDALCSVFTRFGTSPIARRYGEEPCTVHNAKRKQVFAARRVGLWDEV